tara:strand:- start:228 stop:1334 length:1107 start_codon:yes stop_codon:yes gene_type:complete
MVSNARQLAQVPSVPSGRRNLIINGAMNVSQRYEATPQTGLTGANSRYVADRFNFVHNLTSAVFTAEQEPDAPDGFKNSIKLTCTTADASLDAAEYGQVNYKFEGQDLQSLQYGGSSAKSVTVSFYVKSSKTGTYICRLFTPDHSFRANHVSYTINSANTWEKKELKFVGDTSAGITSDHTEGLRLTWWLLAGSNFNSGTSLNPANSWGAYVSADSAVGNVNLADTVNATWQITGVQLEVGNVATEFEHRSFAEDLALCERYCIVYGGDSIYDRVGIGHCSLTTQANIVVTFPVKMRVGPTESTSADSDFALYHANAVTGATTITMNYNSRRVVALDVHVASGLTVGRTAQFISSANTNARITFDSEM